MLLVLVCIFTLIIVYWGLGVTSFILSSYFLGCFWAFSVVSLVVDDLSLIFMFMLGWCGFVALFYCYHYFNGVNYVLVSLIGCFLFVMLVLSLSGTLLFSLIMWEYLGFVSFLLIMFYSNMASLRASLVTLFVSRLGDVSLFVLVSWSYYYWDLTLWLVVFFLLSVLFTKSACYPFISWLVEAMRAPTPVSSLVHSSTLVAAGVWFLFRYNNLFGFEACFFIVLICLVTILISGVCASVFIDLKSIVALSTCSNISWCILFFIYGDFILSLFQLLVHGLCKCFLFMSVGDVMLGSLGSQSSKFVYLGRYWNYFGVLSRFVLVFSLCGVPFLGVFFTKHSLFSLIFYSCGLGSFFLLVVCLCLTYVYSFRFYLLLLSSTGGMISGSYSSFVWVGGLSLLPTIVSVTGYLFFSEVCSVTLDESLMVLFFEVFSCLFGYMLWWLNVNNVWFSLLCGGNYFVNSFYSWLGFMKSYSFIGVYRLEVVLFSFLRDNLFRFYVGDFFSFSFMVVSFLYLVFFCLIIVL
nr:NADH dehydrogenase subunit 5 [Haematoloechus sp. CW13H]